MRATVMYKAGDVRVENVPDTAIQASIEALMNQCTHGVRILALCLGAVNYPSRLAESAKG